MKLCGFDQKLIIQDISQDISAATTKYIAVLLALLFESFGHMKI